MAEIKECCRSGFKWDGKPVGHVGKLGKNDAYITGTNKSAAVLIIHDIFGWTLPNMRLIADHFAKEANVTCYLPDFYDGEVLPEQTIVEAFSGDSAKMALLDLPGFLGRHSKDIRGPEIFACAQALKATYNKVGAIGYCWGGWASFRLGAKGHGLVDCVSVAHPSLLEKSEIDALGVPTQIIAPENDSTFSVEEKEYCNKVIPGLGIDYQYDHYRGLSHGFASRGDPSNPIQKAGLEGAKNSAVAWFTKYLH